MKIALTTILVVILTFFSPYQSLGAAFLIYNQDAKANSMGMAVSASIDNPSSVFYNPALMTETDGYGFLTGDVIIYPKMTYKDPDTGSRYDTKTGAHHVPHLYGKYSKGNIAFGIGIFSPFGLSTEWSSHWPGRYNIIFAEIKTTFINPVFAYRLNDRISFGLGMSYVRSSVSFKSALNLFPLSDGISRLTGDGEGIGFNGSLLIKLPEGYFLSLTYRSPVNIKYNGKAKFYLPPPFISNQTNASTRLTLPFLCVAGIAKKINRFTIEADLLFTGWSSMNSYRIRSDNGMADGFFYKDWHNTFTLALGASYKANKKMEITTGYMLDKTPIPKKTLGPELPDSTRHILTGGYSYTFFDNWRFNLGYQATFFENTRSNLKGFLGRYKGFAQLFMVGFEYNI
ncbi:MAG TPA: outer membrane protein transport protein [Syntrophorhabdaceae bacterium]|nr:outer membrane protein transport protein [Syntrophorhabdaceae bacterium]